MSSRWMAARRRCRRKRIIDDFPAGEILYQASRTAAAQRSTRTPCRPPRRLWRLSSGMVRGIRRHPTKTKPTFIITRCCVADHADRTVFPAPLDARKSAVVSDSGSFQLEFGIPYGDCGRKRLCQLVERLHRSALNIAITADQASFETRNRNFCWTNRRNRAVR